MRGRAEVVVKYISLGLSCTEEHEGFRTKDADLVPSPIVLHEELVSSHDVRVEVPVVVRDIYINLVGT